jgi:UrcA family protein
MLNRTQIAVMGLSTVCGVMAVGSAVRAQPPEPISVQGHHKVFDPDTQVQRVVHFADLNITNEAGRQVLLRRVNWTINDMCEMYVNSNDPFKTASRDCTKTAWNSAKPQLDNVLANAATGTTVAIAIVAAPQEK